MNDEFPNDERHTASGNDGFDCREFEAADSYAAQSAAAAATGWDDPEMNLYNNYDANKRK